MQRGPKSQGDWCLTRGERLCYVLPMDTASSLRRDVTVLAREIGVRSYRDRDRLQKAADYISLRLASFGYAVSRQPFQFRGNTYDNLIAELRGSTSPEKILIIGAHFDTVRTTPGADDN